jgi:leader peptidase (prepilin peptidase)/N-methyltransferase
VPALLRPDGLGLGDVKLAAVLGLFLGGRVALALAVALAAGAAAGAVIVARRGLAAGRRATIPFAPCLALGALAALAAGAPAGAWPRAP